MYTDAISHIPYAPMGAASGVTTASGLRDVAITQKVASRVRQHSALNSESVQMNAVELTA